MDTKLKNIRCSSAIKLFAVLLCVAGALSTAWGLRNVQDFPQAVQGGDYKDSSEYASKIANVYNNLNTVAFQYKSEANIQAGACLADDESYQSTITSLKQQSKNTIAELNKQYGAKAKPTETPADGEGETAVEPTDTPADGEEQVVPTDTPAEGEPTETPAEGAVESLEPSATPEISASPSQQPSTAPSPTATAGTAKGSVLQQKIKQEQDRLDAKLAQMKTKAINNELDEFHSAQDNLSALDGIYYRAVAADGTVTTNVPDSSAGDSFFSDLPQSIQVNHNESNNVLSRGYATFGRVPRGCTVFMGMAKAQYEKANAEYQTRQTRGTSGIYLFGAGALAVLLALGWLLVMAGRRPGADGVQLIFADWLYLDVGLVLAGTIVFFGCAVLIWLYNMISNQLSMNISMVYILGALIVICTTLTVILYFTSVSKRLKRHEFFKHTLIYAAFAWVFRLVRGMFGSGPLALKAGLLFCLYAAVGGLLILAAVASGMNGQGFFAFFFIVLYLIFSLGALLYVLHKVSAVKTILDGTVKIRSGLLGHRIPLTGGGELAQLAGNINTLAGGMDAALAQQLKAERMKTELITNVSHDLKTPLTSIITYIDLLKAEGPAGANAMQYINVLDAKAQRLKALTEDLFEAAKAASGSIKPTLARLDVGELLSQGLGELTDRILESGLDFRCSLPAEKLFVMADGKLLWRVMENLFSNTFKYAQPGSRVYISASRVQGKAVIAVKNVSAFELNIPAEELMERFTRGDQSRHSEGSGLGLAIAKSLVEIQGGRFSIEIDGDLFKAFVDLPESKQ